MEIYNKHTQPEYDSRSVETSVSLEVLRSNPGKFPYGNIRKISDVGSYTIVEYIDEYAGYIKFRVYLDGEDIGQPFNTLEKALVTAVIRKIHVSRETDCLEEAVWKLIRR